MLEDLSTIVTKRSQYQKVLSGLKDVSEEKRRGILRNLCKADLFFLLRYGCSRPDVEHDWIFDRCREVQARPNEYLDLWAREHYKSTIITFALTMQDILSSPEITFGIFSHTRPAAKAFLKQIKREFESNEFLKGLFPDILYADPRKESPKWSEDEGIVVKRTTNPKKALLKLGVWWMVNRLLNTLKFFCMTIWLRKSL